MRLCRYFSVDFMSFLVVTTSKYGQRRWIKNQQPWKFYAANLPLNKQFPKKRLNCFEVTISNTNMKFNGLKWATSRFSEVQFNNEYDILEPLPKLFQCKNNEFRSNTFKMRDYKIFLMRNFVHVSELFLTFLEDLKW